MSKFLDPAILERLAKSDKIEIETRASPYGPVQRTPIWVVAVGDDVYVRSWRGANGRWYQQVTANPNAVVHVGLKYIPVRAVPVRDEDTIAQISNAYLKKYARLPYAVAMLQPETLSATLRLEPARSPETGPIHSPEMELDENETGKSELPQGIALAPAWG